MGDVRREKIEIERPDLSELSQLNDARLKEDYHHLHIYELGEHSETWVLCFHHGKANEVGSAVLEELKRLVDDLESPAGPATLISLSVRRSSKGKPIFIAGANVTERGEWSDERVKVHVRAQRELLARLRQAPVFHLCLITGLALGWGTEYLITADYKIASAGAGFSLPETGLGILPGAGGTSELSSLIGPAHTLRLGMTGELIDGEEAERIGLVQERCDDVQTALERALYLAALISKKSPTSLAAFKRGVLQSIGLPATERREIEALAYEQCVTSGEAAIGRRDFSLIRRGEKPAWGQRHLW